MTETQRNDDEAVTSAPTTIVPDVGETIHRSRLARTEADQKIERAERTVDEVTGMLRRLAAAIDRNPQTWDDLLGPRRPQ